LTLVSSAAKSGRRAHALCGHNYHITLLKEYTQDQIEHLFSCQQQKWVCKSNLFNHCTGAQTMRHYIVPENFNVKTTLTGHRKTCD